MRPATNPSVSLIAILFVSLVGICVLMQVLKWGFYLGPVCAIGGILIGLVTHQYLRDNPEEVVRMGKLRTGSFAASALGLLWFGSSFALFGNQREADSTAVPGTPVPVAQEKPAPQEPVRQTPLPQPDIQSQPQAPDYGNDYNPYSPTPYDAPRRSGRGRRHLVGGSGSSHRGGHYITY